MHEYMNIHRFKEKVTDLKVKRKILFRYLTLKSESIELDFPYNKRMRKIINPLKEAFDSGMSIEIEGKVTGKFPLFKELYKGKVLIEGEDAYKFKYGKTRTFPGASPFNLEYIKDGMSKKRI